MIGSILFISRMTTPFIDMVVGYYKENYVCGYGQAVRETVNNKKQYAIEGR